MRGVRIATPCCALLLSVVAPAQKRAPWDVFFVGQTGQQTTYMADPGGGDGGLPVEIADFDADGFVDWAVAPLMADSGPAGNRRSAGEVVVFRGSGTIAGVIDLVAPPAGQPLLRIYGAASNDFAGNEIFAADVTGDQVTDLIVGVHGADLNGRSTSGAVFVLPGGPQFTGVVDLANPPAWVHRFDGRDSGDRLGLWVEAGDFDGDGTDDLFMSADQGDGATNNQSALGEVFVVYGGQSWPTVVDMRNPGALAHTTVYGEDQGDHFGSNLYGVDLDNDGVEELVASAALSRSNAGTTGSSYAGAAGPNNSRAGAGDTYVLWGRPTRPARIDLDQAPALLVSGDLSIVHGADAGDVLGEEISAGDYDADGFLDLALGSLRSQGTNNQGTRVGEAVVIYGHANLRGMRIDMAQRPAGTCTIFGINSGDILGDTLASCDLNQDGFDDFLVGIPLGEGRRSGQTISNTGQVLILYGNAVRWPRTLLDATVDALLSVPSRRVTGADDFDLLGYSMECGDVDGDGFPDILPNSMTGDGRQNARRNAGEVNIVDGHLFSRGIATVAQVPRLGQQVDFPILGPPSECYIGVFSLGSGPAFPVPGGGALHLAADGLLTASLMASPALFVNTLGALDSAGRGRYGLLLPSFTALAGVELFTAYVTFDCAAPSTLAPSATTSFVLRR